MAGVAPTLAAVDAARPAQGETHYCETLAELVRLLTPRIEQRRKQEAVQAPGGAVARGDDKRRQLTPLCEAGDAAMCDQLAELEWDTQRPGEAVRWWDRARECGRLRSCLPGSQYNPLSAVRDRIPRLRSRCRQGGPDACWELEATIKTHRSSIDALAAKNRPSGVASGLQK